jgi:hypothetical protein
LTRGVPDPVDLVQIGDWSGAHPIHEGVTRVSDCTVTGLELAERGLGATQDELGESRGVRSQSCPQRFEGSGERWGLGDCVAWV